MLEVLARPWVGVRVLSLALLNLYHFNRSRLEIRESQDLAWHSGGMKASSRKKIYIFKKLTLSIKQNKTTITKKKQTNKKEKRKGKKTKRKTASVRNRTRDLVRAGPFHYHYTTCSLTH